MPSGSGGGGGRGRGRGSSVGMISPALVRGRQNAQGGSEMSARSYYSDLRRMGASRDEARRYTQEYINNTRVR